MCGIAGCWNSASVDLIRPMVRALRHRGPDAEGFYEAPDHSVALGHRRLAILDLKTGNQPLANEDGTVWVVLNGEIYNHLDLRHELEQNGHRFATRSDTEALVHAYEEYGDGFVTHLNGDFALALFDQRNGICLLARDRLGIRPLFYTQAGKRLYFASEIKSLLQCPDVGREVDPTSLDQYLSLRYSFGENSMLRGIRRVPPGGTLRLDSGGPCLKRYWKMPMEEHAWDERDAELELERLLQDSIRLRLMSDVPLGMYLSGGVDSALILALMARTSPSQIRTFAIGFGLELDEVSQSRALAARFATEHQEIMLPRDSYLALPEIVRVMDEPLGDSIILPTYWLSKEAARHVKVVLTGEGADEVFGSYIHHWAVTWFDRYRRLCPGVVRAIIRSSVEQVPLQILDRLFPYPENVGLRGRERLKKFLTEAETDNPYLCLVQLFDDDERNTLYSSDYRARRREAWQPEFAGGVGLSESGTQPMLNRLITADCSCWLPDYTLFKQDRLTMANSVEGRVPYLDHRLVEFAGSLPVSLKMRGLTLKYLLRRLAQKYLPREVALRKKAAFYLPLRHFFGRGFSEFVRDTLTPDSVRRDGYFDPARIQQLVSSGLGPELLDSKRLMAALVFTLWSRSYVRSR